LVDGLDVAGIGDNGGVVLQGFEEIHGVPFRWVFAESPMPSS
jgi:hypothetical protein